VFKYAKEIDIDLIIQLGDLGFWEHSRNGHWFLTKINNASLDTGIPFYWIDGNHENHTLLRKKYGRNIFDHPDKQFLNGEFYHSELWYIRRNVFYMPRGSIHSLCGYNFMAFGGSYSVDKASRLEGSSWWPEEMPTIQELDKAIENYDNFNGEIDILLSHDTAYEADMYKLLSYSAHTRIIPNAESVRKTISNLVYKTRPSFLFHGHYHVNCNYDIYCSGKETKCYSLAADGNTFQESVMQIDLSKDHNNLLIDYTENDK